MLDRVTISCVTLFATLLSLLLSSCLELLIYVQLMFGLTPHSFIDYVKMQSYHITSRSVTTNQLISTYTERYIDKIKWNTCSLNSSGDPFLFYSNLAGFFHFRFQVYVHYSKSYLVACKFFFNLISEYDHVMTSVHHTSFSKTKFQIYS